jgi:hypothetical protein
MKLPDVENEVRGMVCSKHREVRVNDDKVAVRGPILKTEGIKSSQQ